MKLSINISRETLLMLQELETALGVEKDTLISILIHVTFKEYKNSKFNINTN